MSPNTPGEFQTDKQLLANQQEIVLGNKEQKTAFVIDMGMATTKARKIVKTIRVTPPAPGQSEVSVQKRAIIGRAKILHSTLKR